MNMPTPHLRLVPFLSRLLNLKSVVLTLFTFATDLYLQTAGHRAGSARRELST